MSSEVLTKEVTMPVGTAISRLVNLQYFVSTLLGSHPEKEREIATLVEALDAFEVTLSFSCDTESEVQEAVMEAETALDVLLCDAETQCCRIEERAASEAARPRKISSSRGD